MSEASGNAGVPLGMVTVRPRVMLRASQAGNGSRSSSAGASQRSAANSPVRNSRPSAPARCSCLWISTMRICRKCVAVSRYNSSQRRSRSAASETPINSKTARSSAWRSGCWRSHRREIRLARQLQRARRARAHPTPTRSALGAPVRVHQHPAAPNDIQHTDWAL